MTAPRKSERPGFAVVEQARKTLLFGPAPAPAPAPTPTSKGQFTGAGTLILRAEEPAKPQAPMTQHFPVDALFSRRAELEQSLQAELTQDFELLDQAKPLVEDVAVPQKRSRIWLRLLQLSLLALSVWLLTLKPDEPATARDPKVLPMSSVSMATTSARPADSQIPLPKVSVDPRVTLQRAAADVLAEGRYAEALVLYRQLVAAEPNNQNYGEVVRLLEQRLKTR